ncbi:protein kinase [Halothiobacillus diazotrophicus]|uniref:Protein kinase n=1 Tax=Halothiobacillus diazotrophicus TaxID=1860122 RepID=A0A191ZJT3_9GAMM|nr:leucine-rich repeat-containing protein kinase family protein [Halothiobacillus diazotrophicus]ANJ68130.1 protein kinase [Halothiobacillus diazotrophicus]
MHTLEQLRSGALNGTQRLRLACGLTEFPREIFELADTLEILDLSGNRLTDLPDDLPRLHRLRILFCSDNRFTQLPAVLGRCPRLEMIGFKANQIRHVPGDALPVDLRWLILTDNRITSLPADIGQCQRLQKLMLAGNRLTELPPELADCHRLELLRISANRLEAFPVWLTTMPRLAWLAYAGNPFCAEQETVARNAAPHDAIDWQTLELAQVLGEGASGIIHQAAQHDSSRTRAVAVKLFKGAVTSDGLPLSEMTACLAAGSHPNLIPVLGRIQDHPNGTHGLVLSLIDPAFGNLAGPPSLASCTRDCYAPECRFDLDTTLQIAHGVASAARHLHAAGIQHGDLYAHNMLHDGQGKILLGDFGAASPRPDDDPELAEALQRIEVRAFACLLEELLERTIDESQEDSDLYAVLDRLKTSGLQENPAARPTLREITQQIEALCLIRHDASTAQTP